MEREEKIIYMGQIREISLKRDVSHLSELPKIPFCPMKPCHVELIPWSCWISLKRARSKLESELEIALNTNLA